LKERVVAAVPWVLLVAAAGGAGYFYLQHYAPLVRDHASLTASHQEAERELTGARAQLKDQTSKIGTLTKDNTTLKSEVAAASKPMGDTQADLATLQAALNKSLAKDIKKGNVTVIDQGSRQGVRISTGALFKAGTMRLTGRGRLRLKAVAQALLELPNQRLQIQGHVDREPLITPALRKAFPSNWELSAGYALQMLLHLNRSEQVPASQLSAAGYGDARPLTDKARGNGRIEILLLGRQPLGGR
jgi:chemotaxis protein MotB